MFGRVITIVTLAAAIVLGMLVQSTNPNSSGPVGILAVFFCIYIIATGLFSWTLYAAAWILHATIPRGILGFGHFNEMLMRRAYYFASILALAPIILIGMSSVGRLGIYEISLVLLFTIIGLFYIQKRA